MYKWLEDLDFIIESIIKSRLQDAVSASDTLVQDMGAPSLGGFAGRVLELSEQIQRDPNSALTGFLELKDRIRAQFPPQLKQKQEKVK